MVRIAFYCPNKPLDHPDPSGDLAISQGLYRELNAAGHVCREVVRFRSRWFWKTPRGRGEAFSQFLRGGRAAFAFRPQLWLTYHTYYKSPDILGPCISRMLGIPYILFQPIYGTGRRKDGATRVGFYLNRVALKACRLAFTNNLNDIEALERIIPRGRITYISPGIFPEEFRRDESAGQQVREAYGIPENVPLLITAARFRPGNKVESLTYLFQSLAMLKGRGLAFRLLVAGDGPMEEEIHRAARSLLPEESVFAGRIPRGELYRYYSAGDIFVFPGIRESLGMVYLEAQACGLPVVALDTAGVPQMVLKDRTGLLVPWDNGLAMADAVRELIENPVLRRQLGAQAVNFVETERNLYRNYTRLSVELEKLPPVFFRA